MATKYGAVRLWKDLINHGYHRAAAGLLTDVLDSVASDEKREQLSTDFQKKLQGIFHGVLDDGGMAGPPPLDDEGKRRLAESRLRAVTDAMAMLEDKTGDRLAEAVKKYASGEPGEPNYWALAWVEDCSRRWGWFHLHAL